MSVREFRFKDLDGNTELAEKMLEADMVINELHEMLLEFKITIKATADEKLIITDQATGEEYVVEDLGYPF